MQVKGIADCSSIKMPNGFQAFVLSIFEWQLKTGFTVNPSLCAKMQYHM